MQKEFSEFEEGKFFTYKKALIILLIFSAIMFGPPLWSMYSQVSSQGGFENSTIPPFFVGLIILLIILFCFYFIKNKKIKALYGLGLGILTFLAWFWALFLVPLQTGSSPDMGSGMYFFLMLMSTTMAAAIGSIIWSIKVLRNKD
jgi:uncharacterized membrane protein YfhO